MGQSVFSQSWHLVAPLKPRLLSHARIFPHHYRAQRWYVLQDVAGGRFHRLSPAAWEFINRMDGRQTVQRIWDEACAAGGEHVPGQEEIVQLLMQLYTNDLLECDVNPDAAEMFARYKKKRQQKWLQWLMNPLSVKIPLLDPDRFLHHLAAATPWLFRRSGLILWLAVVLPALLLAGEHWGELTNNLSDQALSASNLLLLTLLYPLIKACHEIGHGLALKTYGGAVHEMGLMFLVFAPSPYVEASGASALRSKYQRAVVGAAGMMVELFIAAIALYIWLNVESGMVRALCWNTMFIAGVSTLVVNGNPLMRYDAYYILCDLLEIPNMAQRGQRFLTLWFDRIVCGARELEESDESKSERRWLVGYTITSWLYRFWITVTIILFIAGEFFIFGVILALMSAFGLVVKPAWQGINHVLNSPALQRQRSRAKKITFGGIALILLFVCFVPLPLRSQSEGVIWLPDEAMVRAGDNGNFVRWLSKPGAIVQAGQPLLQMEDPLLAAELAVAEAKVAQAQARYDVEHYRNPAQAGILLQQLQFEQQSLQRARERHARLQVRAGAHGVLTSPNDVDMPGQYFKKGQVLAYILKPERLIVRTAVLQDNIDLVRTRLKSASIRISDNPGAVWDSKILRQTPQAQEELPTAALGLNGGGQLAVDPQDPNGMKLLERVFFLDLEIPQQAGVRTFGARVHVRFEHQAEPLALQGWRRLRQLFLSRLHV
ncbi:HlyD family efflux transporter periplasmic adaptor subunit [Massilia sp. W12]|uniref:efflux RND transporter periplasmic adaptor subunit n=1 Tax=Massilia sp. W12 TaxID=3126507 RepID=UPI0030CF5CE0